MFWVNFNIKYVLFIHNSKREDEGQDQASNLSSPYTRCFETKNNFLWNKNCHSFIFNVKQILFHNPSRGTILYARLWNMDLQIIKNKRMAIFVSQKSFCFQNIWIYWLPGLFESGQDQVHKSQLKLWLKINLKNCDNLLDIKGF